MKTSEKSPRALVSTDTTVEVTLLLLGDGESPEFPVSLLIPPQQLRQLCLITTGARRKLRPPKISTDWGGGGVITQSSLILLWQEGAIWDNSL